MKTTLEGIQAAGGICTDTGRAALLAREAEITAALGEVAEDFFTLYRGYPERGTVEELMRLHVPVREYLEKAAGVAKAA